jgi:16S rRNA (guanine(966)-N(2))-methyltransferase RsmD
MRIIGGEHGGRKFNPPAIMPYTRPTTDIAKEGLFNVLQHQLDIEELKTLDLFGGTGSITYELASRGAKDMTIVEKDSSMYEFIKKTSELLRIENIKMVKMDVFKFIGQCTEKFDFIFAGPPYALVNIDDLPKLIFEKQLLYPNGWFVLEHTPKNNYRSFPFYKSERNYGTTVFSTFVNE